MSSGPRTLRAPWAHHRRTLGAPRAHLARTVGAPCARLARTLGALGALWGAPCARLARSLSAHWARLGRTLGASGAHLGRTLGAPWAGLGRTLGAPWAQLGRSLGAPWAHLDAPHGMWSEPRATARPAGPCGAPGTDDQNHSEHRSPLPHMPARGRRRTAAPSACHAEHPHGAILARPPPPRAGRASAGWR